MAVKRFLSDGLTPASAPVSASRHITISREAAVRLIAAVQRVSAAAVVSEVKLQVQTSFDESEAG